MRQPLDMPIPRGVAQRRAGPFSSGSILLAWKTRALFASSTPSARRSLPAERRPLWQRGVVRSLPAHGVGCTIRGVRGDGQLGANTSRRAAWAYVGQGSCPAQSG